MTRTNSALASLIALGTAAPALGAAPLKMSVKLPVPSEVKTVPHVIKLGVEKAPGTLPKAPALQPGRTVKFSKEARLAIVMEALQGESATASDPGTDNVTHVDADTLAAKDVSVWLRYGVLQAQTGSPTFTGWPGDLVRGDKAGLGLSLKATPKSVVLVDCAIAAPTETLQVYVNNGSGSRTQAIPLQSGHLLVPILNDKDAPANMYVDITGTAAGFHYWTGCDVSSYPVR